MSIKTILYFVIVPLSIYALDSININTIFKKNRYYAARLFYLMVCMGLSYLVVNFLYDFFLATQIVSG